MKGKNKDMIISMGKVNKRNNNSNKKDSKNKSPEKDLKNNLKGNDKKNQNIKEEVKEEKKEEVKEEKKEKKEEPPSKISKEKMAELNEKRKKRIIQEKKEEKENKEIFNQLLEENKSMGRRFDFYSSEDLSERKDKPVVKVSKKKAQSILKEGGMIDAYQYLVETLCKDGLPSGNIYEYASNVILSFQKKWKVKKVQDTKEKVEKYWEEKEKEIKEKKESSMAKEQPQSLCVNYMKNTENKNKRIKINLNKSLQERKTNKFIQSLDRSRSTRLIKKIPFAPTKKVEYDPLDMVNIDAKKKAMKEQLKAEKEKEKMEKNKNIGKVKVITNQVNNGINKSNGSIGKIKTNNKIPIGKKRK